MAEAIPGVRSVRIQTRGESPQEVVKAIWECLDKNVVQQVNNSRQDYLIVTLSSQEDKWKLIEKGLRINGKDLPVKMMRGNLRRIELRDVPGELDDDLIVKELEKFGKVRKFTPELFSDDPMIVTGKRIVLMQMEQNVPNFLEVSGWHIHVEYPGVKWQCSRCYSSNHLIKQCPKMACFICGEHGHQRKSCPNKDRMTHLSEVMTLEEEDYSKSVPEKERESDTSITDLEASIKLDSIREKLTEVYDSLEKSIHEEVNQEDCQEEKKKKKIQ
ncbi:uncharacterized protein [Centruroides vittatus]|uniref:uncharacterized protein n=1 Tax=Centruroides vittatus TaxID=120091 RepID=UPI00350F65FD